MVNLRSQKRLAASVAGVGKRKICTDVCRLVAPLYVLMSNWELSLGL